MISLNHMNKFLAIILLIASLALGAAGLVCAQTEPKTGQSLLGDITKKSDFYSQEDAGEMALSIKVGRIISIALGMVGTIFLALTVYAGFLWMTAGGDEEKVTKAKNILQRSVLGMIIVIASYSISYFVVSYVFKV